MVVENDYETLSRIAHETIDSIKQVLDAAKKSDSVKRIANVLRFKQLDARIMDKILEHEVITGLDDLRIAVEDYREITRAGLTPEEYQEEKETAFEAIEEAVSGLDIDEDALESLEAPPVKTKREQIMEFDYAHTLNELKRMAREKGVSPSGTKHAIIARLI